MEIIHRRDGAQVPAPVGYALESARKQADPAMRRARCRVRLGAEGALQAVPGDGGAATLWRSAAGIQGVQDRGGTAPKKAAASSQG